jgi:hypothetical protein
MQIHPNPACKVWFRAAATVALQSCMQLQLASKPQSCWLLVAKQSAECHKDTTAAVVQCHKECRMCIAGELLRNNSWQAKHCWRRRHMARGQQVLLHCRPHKHAQALKMDHTPTRSSSTSAGVHHNSYSLCHAHCRAADDQQMASLKALLVP